MSVWDPQAGDVAVPRGKTYGTFVTVTGSEDDSVWFRRQDAGVEPYFVKNRLSTFLDRFVLMYRPEAPHAPRA